MMNSHQNKIPRRKGFHVSLLIVAFVLIIVLVRSNASAVSVTLGSPFLKLTSGIVSLFSTPLQLITRQGTLVHENERLRAALQSADEEGLRVRLLLEDYDELLSRLGRKIFRVSTTTNETSSFYWGRSPLPALIVSRPPVSLYDTLIIDRGEVEGIKVGMTVFSLGGILLGEVDQLFKHQSRVVLYSSTGQRLSVLIGRKQRALEISGIGGGMMSVNVPRGTGITPEETVSVIHETPWVIGIVRYVDTDTRQTEDRVLIKSAANIYEMKWVVVTAEHLIR